VGKTGSNSITTHSSVA